MTFLPIVGRELRVAARRRLTYWSRPLAAGLALVVFGAILLEAGVSRTMGIQVGRIQFLVLGWMAFILASGSGIFLTSDSLSEEKRDGTLGLLFLTDLRGYDVVLGKLISHSVRAFYGLLAAMPVLALTLMEGGVTGAGFARVTLVICNTLFFSLSIGLLVSSVSRDSTKAMTAAFLLASFFMGGLPAIDGEWALITKGNFQPNLSFLSPGYLLAATNGVGTLDFWPWLCYQHLLAWVFLALASFRAPRAWQEKTNREGRWGSLMRRLRFGGRKFRLRLRRKFLERTPVMWLAMRDRWLARMAGSVGLAVLLIYGWSISGQIYDYFHIRPGASFSFGGGFSEVARMFPTFILVLWVVSFGSWFFNDGIRNGGLELMLVAGVTPREIVRGQWRAMVRVFWFPIAALILAGAIESILNALIMAKAYPPNSENAFTQILTAVCNLAGSWASYAALGFVGMWMGLTTRKNTIAIVKTIGLVTLLPLVALLIFQIGLSAIISFPKTGGSFWFWWNVAPLGLALMKDLFFIFWARRKLVRRFREVVADGGKAPRRRRRKVAVPVLQPGASCASSAAPPVIRSSTEKLQP